MRATFKKSKRQTGLAAVANPYPDTTIKLNGRRIGRIVPPSAFGGDKWRITIIVSQDPTAEDPCEWRNLQFKAKFDTEEAARAWWQSKEEKIFETYKIHPLDL